jgi:hypothetical protein
MEKLWVVSLCIRIIFIKIFSFLILTQKNFSMAVDLFLYSAATSGKIAGSKRKEIGRDEDYEREDSQEHDDDDDDDDGGVIIVSGSDSSPTQADKKTNPKQDGFSVLMTQASKKAKNSGPSNQKKSKITDEGEEKEDSNDVASAESVKKADIVVSIGYGKSIRRIFLSNSLSLTLSLSHSLTLSLTHSLTHSPISIESFGFNELSRNWKRSSIQFFEIICGKDKGD